MPPYEVDGKQVLVVDQGGNPIRTEEYLAARKSAALAGQVYNPTLGFATIRNVSGGRKYPYDPFYGGFTSPVAPPRNPPGLSGCFGSCFGPKKTMPRGGLGVSLRRPEAVYNTLSRPL